jgi:hypothetical protein
MLTSGRKILPTFKEIGKSRCDNVVVALFQKPTIKDILVIF